MRMRSITYVVFPAIVAVLLSACGKSDSGEGAQVAAVVTNPVDTPIPMNPSGSSFPSWCQANSGTLISISGQNVCQFNRSYSMTYYGIGTWNSGLQIYANDAVAVNYSGSASISIGYTSVGAAVSGQAFIAPASGILTLVGKSTFSSYRVSGIFLKRCIGENSQVYQCPVG